MDNILFWNEVALEANRISFTNGKQEQPGPTLSSRALAIVHLAMYDAYAAIDPAAGLPYLPMLTAPPPGATTQAAVAAAAHATLSALYPSQKDFFNSKLSESGGVLNPGYGFGLQVANKILNDRKDDPTNSSQGYVPSFERGKHRVDPDNPGQGYNAPFYGAKSKGFAITARHELAPPPALNDPEYVAALQQVRGKGIASEFMGTLPDDIRKRTINQTVTGTYWGYDGSAGLGTPPRLYNQVVRKVAIDKSNTEPENARLFALINVAMADAGILAWDQKYIHNFWRPVVGIREHDTSMGVAEEAKNNLDNNCDSSWLPLGAQATNSLNGEFAVQQTSPAFPYNQGVVGKMKNFTPNFPSYPSGHATFGAAAFHITRLFYGANSGDKNPDTLFDGLDFVSEEMNGENQDNRGTVRPRHVRNFPGGLWEMIKENGRSRVFLGVHWVFDAFAVDNNNEIDLDREIAGLKIGGVPLGLTIAEDIFNNGMQKSNVGSRP